MAELIAIVILIGSIFGMGVILVRKIPILRTLPIERKLPRENLFSKLKNKIIILNPLKSFSTEIFLQKVLSKIRILTLKIESKTANWLAKLREKSKKKKKLENDNYWEEFKKSTKNK